MSMVTTSTGVHAHGFEPLDTTRLSEILREHSRLPWHPLLERSALAEHYLRRWQEAHASMLLSEETSQHLSGCILESLPWDTQLLGMKCGRLFPLSDPSVPRTVDDRMLIDRAVRAMRDDGYRLIDCKIASTDLPLVRTFEDAGFRVVDMLVTMSIERELVQTIAARMQSRIELLGERTLRVDGTVIVRPIEARDFDAMRALARDAFSDTAEIQDRFFLEPAIDHARARDLFEEWFSNAVQKQHRGEGEVLVAELNGQAVGFLTMNAPEPEHHYWQDSLNAIAPAARGKGVYRALLLGTLHVVAARSESLLTRTQISTTRVINSWLHLGASLVESFFTLHYTP